MAGVRDSDEPLRSKFSSAVHLPTLVDGVVLGFPPAAGACTFPAVGAYEGHAALAFLLVLGGSGGMTSGPRRSHQSFFWNCFDLGQSSDAFVEVREDRWYGGTVPRSRDHPLPLASTWWA